MADAAPGAGAREADTAALAHDLANVIAVLAGSSAMLADDLAALPGDHPAHEQAARIDLATTRAAELCERMRASHRFPVATGRSRTVRPGTFDLASSVREACGLIGPALADGCSFTSDSAGLPVRGEALDAFQIVLNLTLNASEASGGPVRLHVDRHVAGKAAALLGRTMPGRTYARLTVDDDGAGLPDDAVKLFERGTTGSGDPARGTGLSTIAAIVEKAGGALRAGSSASGGASIEVLWPLAVPQAALEDACVLIVAGPTGPTARAADALEAAGAEPSLCLDVDDAVASLADDSGIWDAAVVTGAVRGSSAVDVAERLATADPATPVLALGAIDLAGVTCLPSDVTGGAIVEALAARLACPAGDDA